MRMIYYVYSSNEKSRAISYSNFLLMKKNHVHNCNTYKIVESAWKLTRESKQLVSNLNKE